MSVHLTPTQAQGAALMARGLTGPVTMLNLLRFHEVADYSATPELAPPDAITGAQAFARYITHATPHLEASGGALLFLGSGGPWFIGPENEGWDAAMLVRQSSIAAFLSFAANEAYMDVIAHRTAALLDARLLPLQDVTDKGTDPWTTSTPTA